jgi:hypothetical protein
VEKDGNLCLGAGIVVVVVVWWCGGATADELRPVLDKVLAVACPGAAGLAKGLNVSEAARVLCRALDC